MFGIGHLFTSPLHWDNTKGSSIVIWNGVRESWCYFFEDEGHIFIKEISQQTFLACPICIITIKYLSSRINKQYQSEKEYSRGITHCLKNRG